MKTVDAGQFAANVNQYLQDSQSEPFILTLAGKPCAVVQGVNYDQEQLGVVNSAEFWSMIRERRQRETVPWEEAKKRLLSQDD